MVTRRRKVSEEDLVDEPNPLMRDVVEVTNYIPVEGNRDLVRDARSGAILNINKKAYLRAIRERQARTQSVDELESLKNEVSELKAMLATLLEKVK
jgi:hypothetical protein